MIIPAYNEERRIAASIEKILLYSGQHPGEIAEIVVVDDGSRDETAAIIRSLQAGTPNLRLVAYGPNAGKGYAVRRGVMEARGDLVLISDADLSTPIDQISVLREAMNGADVVIGSRAIDPFTVKVRQGKLRQFLGRSFNRLMRTVTALPFLDTQCGFKLLRRSAARRIFSLATIDRFAYDVEMLMIALAEGYRIAEVPVLWYNSSDSQVRIVRDSLRMLWDVLIIRRRLGNSRTLQKPYI